ncbi:hypothetical protein GCM10009846_20990 [Agrococcus versicolor]|uniref:YlxR domain-containing protein n=2 Tax=Agrococcus versicolor TaxID=501482 RepID=A0ABN3ATC0_9MICO
MPIRMCLGCRVRCEQDALVRLAAADGAVVVDESRRLPGRGAWVHRDAACVERATRSLSHALRSRHLDATPVEDWAARLAGDGHDRKTETTMDN